MKRFVFAVLAVLVLSSLLVAAPAARSVAAVDSYHPARHAEFGDYTPPSTSRPLLISASFSPVQFTALNIGDCKTTPGSLSSRARLAASIQTAEPETVPC